MKTNFDEVLTRITDFLKTEAKTETVIGKEFKLGEFTCVPVIRVGLGFGYGGGEGEDTKKGHGEGVGGGGGIGVEPIGFLVTRGGEITFVQAARSSKGIAAAFEKMPDVLDKFLTSKDKETASSN